MKKATLLTGLFAFVLALSVSAQEPVVTEKKTEKKECCKEKKEGECKEKKEACGDKSAAGEKKACCSEKKEAAKK